MYTSKYYYNEFAYCNPAYSKVSFILPMPPFPPKKKNVFFYFVKYNNL